MIFWPRARFEWRLRTRSVLLGEYTRIVGVVSVGKGGDGVYRAAGAKLAVAAAVEAVDAGADIVELSVAADGAAGGAGEEQGLLLPVLEGFMMERPEAVVAVAVRYAATGRAAVRMGAEILGEVGDGEGWDEAFAGVVAQTGCGLVLRRGRGAEGRVARGAVVPEVFTALCERVMLAEAAGIEVEQIVADPGFGGGDLGGSAGEFALLAGLGRLRQLDRPLMMGVRRASVQGAAAVAGSVAAVLAGAHLLRVRDVAAAREAVLVADGVLNAGDGAGG